MIFFPIYRHSECDYYKEQDKWVGSQKKQFECLSGYSFDELSRENKISLEDDWFWPYWKFNDIVGCFDIGTDGRDSMIADIYLKHKWLPRNDKNRVSNNAYGAAHLDVKRGHGLFHYREIDKVKVKLDVKYPIN